MPIAYVYHRRAEGFRGDTLYPLHALRDVHPDLYETAKRKYEGRERIMEVRVPLLDVRRNDVVHCAPIHPHLILRALLEAGSPQPARPSEWFRIPVERLAPRRTVWHGDECEWFEPARLEELGAIPERTVAYYREMYVSGRRPLLFVGVPHVLVGAPIDVSGVEVIDWRTPSDA